MIEVTWAAGRRLVTDARVRSAVRAALEHGGREGIELAVVFVSDPELAELHGRTLGDTSPTDVIAFDLGEEGGGPAGEVYVSVDRARDVAARRGLDPARELLLYVVHGTLHLCGHDDTEPAARTRMRRAERAVLASLGL